MDAARSRSVVVATHGHCFDGLASAVIFTQLYRELHPGTDATFSYRACDYGPGDSAVPGAWLDGDDNAILDFRYTALPTLTWYFDHHATAFRDEADQEHYGRLPEGQHFYDAAYSSCTRLIADVGRAQLGARLAGLDDLIGWADRIDAARFASAEEAVRRQAPALHLMTVLEHHGDAGALAELVPRLLREPLDEVAGSAWVRERREPLEAQRLASLDRLRAVAEQRGAVAFCDLSGETSEVSEKFGLYWLFPRACYSVALVRNGHGKLKVSVGYNPWSGITRAHHIGEICRRHGGGGHPVVGAINLGARELERAQAICADILKELGA
ncbi:MAG: hypothetical protein EOO75_02915 [Myxococcales bacterium]|nr:MAG: hypothetical protein EOO75_02915 [Myxococcales bacterium]